MLQPRRSRRYDDASLRPVRPWRRARWRPSPARRSGRARWRPDQTGRALRPAIIWMDSRGAPQARPVAGGPVRVRDYGVGKLARWDRRCSRPQRQGPARAHPVARTPRAGHLLARAVLPRADGLDRLPAHRARRGDVRLDRAALGERQSRPRRRPLRPGAAATGRRGAVATARSRRRHRRPRPLLPDRLPSWACRPASRWWPGRPTSSRPRSAPYWLTCHVPYKKTGLMRNMASLPSAIAGRYFVADEQETAGGTLTFLCGRMLFVESYAEQVGRLHMAAAARPAGRRRAGSPRGCGSWRSASTSGAHCAGLVRGSSDVQPRRSVDPAADDAGQDVVDRGRDEQRADVPTRRPGTRYRRRLAVSDDHERSAVNCDDLRASRVVVVTVAEAALLLYVVVRP